MNERFRKTQIEETLKTLNRKSNSNKKRPINQRNKQQTHNFSVAEKQT